MAIIDIFTFRTRGFCRFVLFSPSNLSFSLEFAHFYEKWFIFSRSEAITGLRLFTIESFSYYRMRKHFFKRFFYYCILFTVTKTTYIEDSGGNALYNGVLWWILPLIKQFKLSTPILFCKTLHIKIDLRLLSMISSGLKMFFSMFQKSDRHTVYGISYAAYF